MGIEAVIELIFNNGIGMVCVAFMIIYINTTMKEQTQTLNEIVKTLAIIQNNLTNLSVDVEKLKERK